MNCWDKVFAHAGYCMLTYKLCILATYIANSQLALIGEDPKQCVWPGALWIIYACADMCLIDCS